MTWAGRMEFYVLFGALLQMNLIKFGWCDSFQFIKSQIQRREIIALKLGDIVLPHTSYWRVCHQTVLTATSKLIILSSRSWKKIKGDELANCHYYELSVFFLCTNWLLLLSVFWRHRSRIYKVYLCMCLSVIWSFTSRALQFSKENRSELGQRLVIYMKTTHACQWHRHAYTNRSAALSLPVQCSLLSAVLPGTFSGGESD